VRLGWKTFLVLLAIASSCEVPNTHLPATHRSASDGGTADTADARSVSVDVRRDGGCQQSDFDLTAPQADVMLVVERSGVMNTPAFSACSTCGTYWTTLIDALKTLTTTTSANFRWGLKLFPSPGDVDACFVTAPPDVPLTSDAGAIASALTAGAPKGGAPSAIALRQAVGYLDFVQSSGLQIVVLAMGGTPTCMMGDPSQDDLAATQAEVPEWPTPLYVLGPGPDQPALNSLGYAGSGIPRFSTDAVQYLGKAMRGAALGWATSCTFPLPGPVAPGQTVNVLLDGMPIPAGPGGFVFTQDGTQVWIQGGYCYSLGNHANVTIKIGC
jgi:hypothetical protein